MIETQFRRLGSVLTALMLTAGGPGLTLADQRSSAEHFQTKTPIKHVVVIFQENVSFDHYFGTYPFAANPAGEPRFKAKKDTPAVNGLLAAGLLDENPNTTKPFRLDRSQAVTCDQNHNYPDEQKAFNHGLMDMFPEKVGVGTNTFPNSPCPDFGKGPGLVMGYYDGNTVTALWNYAQNFAMSDNSYGTTFGPSTPGAVNLIAGTNSGATLTLIKPNGNPGSGGGQIAGGLNSGAVIGDPRPTRDDCSSTTAGLQNSNQIDITGKNVGDLLNDKGITWGWFNGGFAPTSHDAKGRAICGQHHTGLAGDDAVTQSSNGDYIPHHEPFQYFANTVNPHHTRPSNSSLIGTSSDGANHQYDLVDFFTALRENHLPAVSYLKAPAFQDGHAAYSDPLDEQTFLVNVINALQLSRDWDDTAVIIAYDDSDGWYDHQMSSIVNQSNTTDDNLSEPGQCGFTSSGAVPGRCGYGPRLPLLVISPFARQNFVDHNITDQSSILRFVEDNWQLDRIGGDSNDAKAGSIEGMFDFNGPRAHRLFLDPGTGLSLFGLN